VLALGEGLITGLQQPRREPGERASSGRAFVRCLPAGGIVLSG